MKRGKSYDWIPLWIDKWLMGSTRFELDPSERSVFIDLMVLAAKDEGFIRANAGMGYPHEWLSRSLNIPLEVLEKAIEKCIECEKIIDKGKGIYFITNWDSYRLSGSYKRAITLGIKPMPGSKETVSVSEETDTVSPSMYMYKYKSPFKSKSKFKSKSSLFSGIAMDVIEYLNLKTNKNYRLNNPKTKELISARIKINKATLDDFKKVIDIKAGEWLGTENDKYLRPETLFGTKFESYLNQKLRPSLEEAGEAWIKRMEEKEAREKKDKDDNKKDF